MSKKVLKCIGIILFIIIFLVIGVILTYNFGWRLWGFSGCVSPERYITYHYEIKDNSIELLINKGVAHDTGRTLGYIVEEKDGILKIGIKYNIGIIGLLESGSWMETFTIPITSKPSKIILCGNGYEIDINDHINEEAYESIKDLITI